MDSLEKTMGYLDLIRDATSLPSRYELLAEEAAELSKAALKYARYLRGEQPMAQDLTEEKLISDIMEEYGDVILTFDSVMDFSFDEKVATKVIEDYDAKLERWVERIYGKPIQDRKEAENGSKF